MSLVELCQVVNHLHKQKGMAVPRFYELVKPCRDTNLRKGYYSRPRATVPPMPLSTALVPMTPGDQAEKHHAFAVVSFAITSANTALH